MRQKRFPCCKEPMDESTIFSLIEDVGSCPTVVCPHCSKFLTVFLNVDSVEVDEEAEDD